MPEYPVCPVCDHKLEDSVPDSLDGPIRIRCPFCSQLYEYDPQTGSVPIDDDLGITVTKGILGPHIVTRGPTVEDDISLSRALFIGAACCCTLVIIIPVIVSLILSLF